MVIKTYFHNNGNGAKITAKTMENGKRKQLTIDYPHHLSGEEKHRLAAQMLYVKLYGKPAKFESECMSMYKRHSYEFRPINK